MIQNFSATKEKWQSQIRQDEFDTKFEEEIIMRGMGNMQGMMKKMQKMQKEMLEAQEALNAQQFEGTAGGGMVKATVNGQRELVGVNLDPSVVDPEDVELLQDLVIVAVNDALKKVETTTNATMGKFTQGMNLPF